MALLAQNGLDIGILSPEGRQLLLCDLNALFSILEAVPLAQFCGQELQFAFRAPGEFVVGGHALSPFAVNVGKPHTHIKGFLLVAAGSFHQSSV